ncbi:MAG: VTT domain-containing protein, partial [Cyanobacteria bacterium J06638_6]
RTLGKSSLQTVSGKTLRFSTQRGHVLLGWMVFVSRLLPVVSFDLVSYGAGIAQLSVPIYAIATLFGMVPPVLLLTYMGDAFTLSTTYVITFWLVFGAIFLAGVWMMRRCSWLGLRDDSQ